MIYVVLGFHKSGTTLVARTLHESGIDMGVTCRGQYPHCKYEDPRAQQISKDILYNGKRRKSFEQPTGYTDQTQAIRKYIEARQAEGNENWGFKVPDITLCYEMWRNVLPVHRVIGVVRSLDGVLAHYARRGNPPDHGVVKYAWHMYRTMMESYGVPIIRFENIIARGPIVIEQALGRFGLPDVRDGKTHE